MNKIENLAYLFATMMDSDGKVNVKELNTWHEIVAKRWPEVPGEIAGNALKNSLYSLKSQNEAERIDNLEKVVATAFNQRRKMLRSSLKSLTPNINKILTDLKIDPAARAENLTVEEFCLLANYLKVG